MSLSTTFAQQQREEIVGILIKFSAPPRILLPSIITVDNGSLVRSVLCFVCFMWPISLMWLRQAGES